MPSNNPYASTAESPSFASFELISAELAWWKRKEDENTI